MASRSAGLSAILEAAMEVFFRFGFKKASMDDVARAAGISRQGLYLKFSNKEQLFRGALEHLVSRLLRESTNIAARGDLDIEERLLRIFHAVHSNLGSHADTAELLDLARSKHRDIVATFEAAFIAIVKGLLVESDVDKRWSSARITAGELAEHLLFAASGIQANVSTAEEYKVKMAVSIAVVVRGAASRAGGWSIPRAR